MTDKNDSAHEDRNLLSRYLLGRLSDDDRDRLEHRLLADAALSDEAAVVEDELLDAYATGELPHGQRRDLETRLAASPRLRWRLAFARTLGRAAAASQASGAAGEAGRPGRLRRGLRWPAWLQLQPTLGLAAAAASLVLAVLCGTLLWQSNELRRQVAGLELERGRLAAEQRRLSAESAGLDRRLASERSQAESLETELTAARQRTSELEQELERRRPRPERSALTASFVLSAALRSDLGLRTVELPETAERVRLRLDLGVEEQFPSFLAVVQGPTGSEVWSEAGLAAAIRQPATAVDLVLPAAALRAGRHEVLLYGEAAGGEPELVGAFALDVAGR